MTGRLTLLAFGWTPQGILQWFLALIKQVGPIYVIRHPNRAASDDVLTKFIGMGEELHEAKASDCTDLLVNQVRFTLLGLKT